MPTNSSPCSTCPETTLCAFPRPELCSSPPYTWRVSTANWFSSSSKLFIAIDFVFNMSFPPLALLAGGGRVHLGLAHPAAHRPPCVSYLRPRLPSDHLRAPNVRTASSPPGGRAPLPCPDCSAGAIQAPCGGCPRRRKRQRWRALAGSYCKPDICAKLGGTHI